MVACVVADRRKRSNSSGRRELKTVGRLDYERHRDSWKGRGTGWCMAFRMRETVEQSDSRKEDITCNQHVDIMQQDNKVNSWRKHRKAYFIIIFP